VPSGRYHEARILLAGQGLPKAQSRGVLDSLKDQSAMTSSQFMEQARYSAAIEQELAKSIAQIGSIQSARVHLAQIKQSAFVRERTPVKASVVVVPYGGRAISANQVQAIVHLVASSVPMLLPENVSIVDNVGKLMTDASSEAAMGLNATQSKYKQSLEDLYRHRVLEILVAHPSTAKHVAEKLCRKFIADEPPAEAVAATAEAFAASGGDVPTTLRALFATETFWQPAGRGGKFKRPFHFVVSALRATNAETDASKALVDYLVRLGHAPFRYATPDGYPEAASHWQSSLLWRWNFACALVGNGIKGTSIAGEELRERLGGDEGLMATVLGRRASDAEREAYHESGSGLALLLASPAFQSC
jgi:type III secretory pathway lipoprotein EscJ